MLRAEAGTRRPMSLRFAIPRTVLAQALVSLAIEDPQKALHQAMRFLVRRYERFWAEADSLERSTIPEVGLPDHCHHCQGPCRAPGLASPTRAEDGTDSEWLQLSVDRDLLDTVAYILVRGGGGCARAIVHKILEHGCELWRLGSALGWTSPTTPEDAFDQLWSLAPDDAYFPGDLFRIDLDAELKALDLKIAQGDAEHARRIGKIH